MNTKTLKECIIAILVNSNEPLSINEIAEFVLEAGYKTTSKNFANVVTQLVIHDDTFKKKTKKNNRYVRYALE